MAGQGEAHGLEVRRSIHEIEQRRLLFLFQRGSGRLRLADQTVQKLSNPRLKQQGTGYRPDFRELNGAHFFAAFLTRSSTTLGSASVVVSPRLDVSPSA